jgi:predicted nucleic acid-binding protein
VIRVFLDADVLYKKILLSTFLDMAEREIFTFLWSREVINEFSRNRIEKGSNPKIIDLICQGIEESFGGGIVERRDFEELKEKLKITDIKDRHILAAAAVGGADYLVTFNLSDYDKKEAKNLDVEIIHPDSFLMILFNSNKSEVLSSLKFTRARRQNPTTTNKEFLQHLKKAEILKFSEMLSSYLGNF